MEIERKYLIRELPENLETYSYHDIDLRRHDPRRGGVSHRGSRQHFHPAGLVHRRCDLQKRIP